MKELTTEIIIDATPNQVWNILMAKEEYPNWNPFIKSIKGSTEKGKQIEVSIQPPGSKPMVFKPTVLRNETAKEFRWLGHLFVKGLFDGEHYFKLEATKANQTKFTHGEAFTGILSGVLLKMIGENTLKGFIAMNEALKVKAENKNKLK